MKFVWPVHNKQFLSDQSTQTTELGLVIKTLEEKDFDRFFAYLTAQLSENGTSGPVFQPLSRYADSVPAETMAAFIRGLSVPIGAPGWRRAWIAEAESGDILGHIDLRARPEPYTEHRALLGMGVSRTCRRAGLGQSLVEFVSSWARESSVIKYIDLAVLSGNVPAIGLYDKLGFTRIGEIPDMFRIDGVSHGNIQMTKPLGDT